MHTAPHLQLVVAGGDVAQGDDAVLRRNPVFLHPLQEIAVLHISLQGIVLYVERQGEGVLVIRQRDMLLIREIDDAVVALQGGDEREGGDEHLGSLMAAENLGGIKIAESLGGAEIDPAAFCLRHTGIVEVRLRHIVLVAEVEDAPICGEATDAPVGTHPDVVLSVLCECPDVGVVESLLHGIGLGGGDVAADEADGSLVGGSPYTLLTVEEEVVDDIGGQDMRTRRRRGDKVFHPLHASIEHVDAIAVISHPYSVLGILRDCPHQVVAHPVSLHHFHGTGVHDIDALAGAHPHPAVTVLIEAPHVRCLQGQPGEAARCRPHISALVEGAEPEVALAVAKGGDDIPAHLRGVSGDALLLGREHVDTIAIGTHPQFAVPVEGECHDGALCEPVLLGMIAIGDGLEERSALRQEVDAVTIESCPHIMILVFQEAPHGVACQVILRVALLQEGAGIVVAGIEGLSVQVEHGDALCLRRHPDVAVGELLDVVDAKALQLVLRHMDEPLVHLVEDVESLCRTYPDGAVPVLVDALHLVVGDGVGVVSIVAVVACHAVVGVDDAQSRLHMTRHDDAVAQVGDTPELVVGHSLHVLLIIMRVDALLGIEILHALPIGRDPDVAIGGGSDMGDVVGGDAVLVLLVVPIAEEGVGIVVEAVESVVLGSYPEPGMPRVVEHAVEFAAGDALCAAALVVVEEPFAVEAVESLLGGNPQEPVLVLRHVDDIVARQPPLQPQ